MAQSDPMIDLTLDYHAHILPRCDHGSDGVETSLRQLAMAAEASAPRRTSTRTARTPPPFWSAERAAPRRCRAGRSFRASCWGPRS